MQGRLRVPFGEEHVLTALASLSTVRPKARWFTLALLPDSLDSSWLSSNLVTVSRPS